MVKRGADVALDVASSTTFAVLKWKIKKDWTGAVR